MDNQSTDRQKPMDSPRPVRMISMKTILLSLNCLMLAIGIVGGPLVMQLYFLHGGHRNWLQSFLETAGFPVMLIPILFVGYRRRRLASTEDKSSILRISWRLFICASVIGVLSGTSDFLYARGNQLIPVSTSSLVLSTHLVFTAVFCYFLVGQKFTAFIINAIVLLTTGAVVLATASGGGGGHESTSRGMYLKGFFMVMGSGAIFAAVLPLVELCYMKARTEVNYQLVMEMQFVLSMSATVFCACGMAVNKDWQAISREAQNSDLGPTLYYCVLVACSLTWQFFFLGVLGVIHFGSSLLSAIITAVCLPLSELLAVVFYGEKFQPEKGVALILSLWGFVSYFYGELQNSKKQKKTNNNAPPHQVVIQTP